MPKERLRSNTRIGRRPFLRTAGLVGLSSVAVGTASAHKGNTVHVHPGESIQKAINHANPGDTVLIHSGTYREGRIAVNTDDLTVKGAGQVTITADTDEVNNDAPGDPSDDNKATVTTRGGDGVTLKHLEIVRVINPEEYDYVDPSNRNDQNTKALGVKSSGVTVKNCTLRVDDHQQEVDDVQSNAVWVANNFKKTAPAVENVTLKNNTLVGDPTDTGAESTDDFRNALAIFSLSNNGVRNIKAVGNTFSDAANGVVTGVYPEGRGDVENVQLIGNEFENVDDKIQDDADAISKNRGGH